MKKKIPEMFREFEKYMRETVGHKGYNYDHAPETQP
jgi:hypothetical protein